MTQIWRAYGDVAITGVFFLVPVALAILVLRTRKLSATYPHALVLALAEVGAGLATLLSFIIVLQPSANLHARSVDLVPFNDFRSSAWSIQLFGNLLLLIPAGVLIARFTRPVSKLRLISTVGLPVLIEVLQWIRGTGRVSSTEDIIVGILSICIGLAIGTALMRLLGFPRAEEVMAIQQQPTSGMFRSP
jgi:glycopeptide antibiotics resistance protein